MDDNPDYVTVFTDSFMITKWTIDGKELVSPTEYYLSDVPVDDFDRKKVGKVRNGRYIIENVRRRVSGNGRKFVTNSFPIHLITDDKLVLEFNNQSVFSFHRKE